MHPRSPLRSRIPPAIRGSTSSMTSAVCSTRTLLITLLTLLALLLVNVFVRGLARVSLEAVPDVERDDEEPISLWPGYAHEAPRGKTCEQWLTQADEQPGSTREWQQQPVVIAAGEERTVRDCAVPCLLVRDPCESSRAELSRKS